LVTEFADSGNPDIEDTAFFADLLTNAIHAFPRSFSSTRRQTSGLNVIHSIFLPKVEKPYKHLSSRPKYSETGTM
jgi:hypothetical protein